MRLINCQVFIQIFVYAGLLQKFAHASSALEHDETHTSDYYIDEMVYYKPYVFENLRSIKYIG